MISSGVVNTPNNAIAPAGLPGQRPTGQETLESRQSTIKPVEQLESPARPQVRLRQEQPLTDDIGGATSSGITEAQQEERNQEQALKEAREIQQLEVDRRRIQELAARDREVRAHEQAHMAAGGQYAGAASYQYERGPDGVNYAVSGEVPIDTGRESTPQATIQKAQVVKRAALAPAEPSAQDRRVAAQAAQIESRARADLAELQRQEMETQKENIDETQTEAITSEGNVTSADSEATNKDSNDRESNVVDSSDDSPTNTISSSNSRPINIADGSASEVGNLISQIA